MMKFGRVSYWFPNAETGSFCEYLNAVYIVANKEIELFMKQQIDFYQILTKYYQVKNIFYSQKN